MQHRFACAVASLLLVAACVDNGSGVTPEDMSLPHDLKGYHPADLKGTHPVDMKGNPPPPDLTMTMQAVDMAPSGPPSGTVGDSGGTVDRLYFAFHGDTRPPNVGETSGYPTSIIQSIFQAEGQKGVQFAVTTGDYMFCSSNDSTCANDQLNLYLDAANKLGKPVFLSMGNHECTSETSICSSPSACAKTQVFASAISSYSGGKLWYSFNVNTSQGRATFVSVADNAWGSAEQSWLESTLADADAHSKYTIIFRHHPVDNTDLTAFTDIWNLIQQHKYTLQLYGHAHEYTHDVFRDTSGRSVKLGTAGAPFDGSGYFYGYGTVEQGLDGKLYVTVYDVMSGAQKDAFSVTPQ